MTEDETFRKLRQVPFRIVNSALIADYQIFTDGSIWYHEYLVFGQGKSTSILAKHGWTEEEFQIARIEYGKALVDEAYATQYSLT
jgi:hypothetical protein